MDLLRLTLQYSITPPGQFLAGSIRWRQLALAEISARIQIKQDKGNAENWPQQRPD